MKAVFFDLFFTLIVPCYSQVENEFDIVGLTLEKWEQYAENSVLYEERALGNVSSETEIIERILSAIPGRFTEEQKRQVLKARESRMRQALLNVPDEILQTLECLKRGDIKIGLISNADRIDCKYWGESELAPYFDITIFSCDAGLLKPDPRIYQMAMDKLMVNPADSVFVGDGGSEELAGAKRAGMRTIFSEFLDIKTDERRKEILQWADAHIMKFGDVLNYME